MAVVSTMLKEELKKQGISLKDLAEKLGSPFSTVANKFGGYATMDGEFIEKVLRVIESAKTRTGESK
jgi:transcriptional regulator with XRE-family HTH domain